MVMRIPLAGLLVVLLVACGSRNKSEEQALLETLDKPDAENQVISGEVSDVAHITGD